jgi:hypothetical protein
MSTASPTTPTLNARSLKVTLVLDPAELLALPAPPDGKPRYSIRITVGGRTLTADLSAKSIRKAIAAIREHGADGVAAILQGKLATSDSIEEAGLTVQPRVAKPAQSVWHQQTA